jgi:hypothetical protein
VLGTSTEPRGSARPDAQAQQASRAVEAGESTSALSALWWADMNRKTAGEHPSITKELVDASTVDSEYLLEFGYRSSLFPCCYDCGS